MTEHIDRDRLNEDLRYRFEYLSKFVHFTDVDLNAMNILSNIIVPVIPVIVDSVYRKLFQYDLTKHFFVLRNDGFDGQLDNHEMLTLDSAQMTYRHDMLSGFLKRLFLQRQWTDDFLQYVSRIGRLHTDKAGSASINVDFIHINATFTYIEILIMEIVWKSEMVDEKGKQEISLALTKVFRILSDLFLFHYIEPAMKSNDDKTEKCVCS